MSNGKWDDAELKRLRELWRDSRHTTREIADILQEEFNRPFTKNAVIGKAKRLGLIGQRSVNDLQHRSRTNGADRNVRPPTRRKRPSYSKAPVHTGGYPSAERQEAARAGQLADREKLRTFSYTVTLGELTEKTCKYPDPDTDDPMDLRFCGLPRVSGSKWPYCEGHLEFAKDEKYRSKQ